MENGSELMGVTEWMPATVPGGVHYDLYRAGWIEHPWFEQNSLACEWVENRWWIYQTVLDGHELPDAGSKVELIMRGIDYEALVYLNEEYLGEHIGMFHHAVFDITDFYRNGTQLTLTIICKHAPDEMSQIGRTSQTYTQKSRFNYKWDFSTRLVNIGIWDEVYLQVHNRYSMKDVVVTSRPELNASRGSIRVSACIQATDPRVDNARLSAETKLSLNMSLLDPEGNECAFLVCPVQPASGCVEAELAVQQPRLWYPNGYGEQPLYQLLLELKIDECCLDRQVIQTGFRTLTYERNEGSPPDALPYTFVVNGNRVYIQGVNITPIDHLYGNVLPEQYGYMLEMIKRAGMNMVRVWGGGLIEKDVFYDLCDRYGIMVWQEFIQSSSGVDNIPSKQPQFLKLLRESAISALIRKRNHISLAVWSGGNELMDESGTPSTFEDENIALLKNLVEQYDSQRQFLPTSASGPVEFVTKEKGVSHDVHGFWKYLGHPEHYEFYGDVDHLFHSEFGVDGMSSPKSLCKFLGESQRVPVSMKDSLIWRHHGEWWDTLERDIALFGPLESLTILSDASQWIQAEGLRFILQTNRRRQFHNSGSLIWQLNEPYPNVSNTCLIDYYGEAKMAYYWTRQVFRPLHASLDYRKLGYRVGEVLEAPVYFCATRKTMASVIARVYDAQGNMRNEQCLGGNRNEGAGARQIGVFSLRITESLGELFIVRLSIEEDQGDFLPQDYFFTVGEEAVYAPALRLSGAVLEVGAPGNWEAGNVTKEGLSSLRRNYKIRNNGQVSALHVRCEETTNAYWMEATDQFFTLLPGESREIGVTCFRKRAGGFLEEDSVDDSTFPMLKFRSFGDANGECL